MSIDKLKTKFITGAFINDVKHYFSKINEIIDWINNIGAPSYKVYTALLTQTGTDAPVPTILQNTLGADITWSYAGQGTYNGTLSGVFVEDKTFLAINKSRAGGRQFSLYRNDDNEIEVITEIFDGLTPVFTATDDILIKTSIEIRVYN